MKATKSLADLLTFWLIVVFVGFSPLTALASSDTNTITQNTTWSVLEENSYNWVSTPAGEVNVDNGMVSSTTVNEGATLTIVAPTQTSAPYSFQEISGGGSVHFKSTDFGVHGTDFSVAGQQGGTAVSVGSLTAEDCGLNIEGGKGVGGGTGGTGVTGALTAGKGSVVTVTGGEGGSANAKGGNGGTGVTGALTVDEGSVVTVTGGKGGDGGMGGTNGDGGTGVTGEVTLAGGELKVTGGSGYESGSAFGNNASITIAEGYAYTNGDGQTLFPAGKYTKSTSTSIDAFAGNTIVQCEAKIGNTFYATLQKAINAAEVGDTITLVRDVEQKTTLTLNPAKSLSLDLNGRKLLFNSGTEENFKYFMCDDKHMATITGSGTIEAKGPNASGNTMPLWRFVRDAAGTGTLTILDDAAMKNIQNTGDRPWDAFTNSITEAALEKGVTKIGVVTFCACENLKTITLPATVTSINEDSSGLLPFDRCPKLEKITVDAGNSTYSNNNGDGVLYTKDKTTLIFCPRGKTGTLTVPAEVTTLKKYSFNNYNSTMSLSRIEFARTEPGTLSTDSAFYSYTGDCVLVAPDGMLIDNQKQVLVSAWVSAWSKEVTFRAVTPWDELQDALNKGGTVTLTRSYDYTKDSYEINGWGSTSHYGKLIVPKDTVLDLNGHKLTADFLTGDGEFTVKGGTLNCTHLANNATMGAPTNAAYGTLTLDDATVTTDQLLWFGGMALMESTLTVGESEEGAGNNGKNINVTWVQPESGAMLTMDTASSVTLPQQQETDGQWRLTDFQTSEDVAAAAGQLGAYLPRGWTFETITGTRVYGVSEQPYYALAVKDTAGAYPTSVTLKLITDSVPATVTANDRTYDGTEQPLVTVDNTNLVGGVMLYAVTDEYTAPTDESLYTTSIPTATNAGTYYVWYKVVGDANHSGIEPACVTVTIAPAPGEVQTETHADPAAYNVKAENLDQAAGAVMTDEERQRVDKGEILLLYMDVTNIDATVSDADKALIAEAAAAAAALAGEESPATILQYLDFFLFKKVGSDDPQQITETAAEVGVTIDIPEDKQAEGRIFFIARIHNGVVEIIAQGTGKSITCYTNLFSTYALLYIDPPKTSGDVMETLLATMLSGGEDTLNLTWTTVPNAGSYDVFFGKTKPQYVATVTGNSYTFTGLKKGMNYKAYVKAAGQTSPTVQCYTDKGAKPGSNPGQVTLGQTELTVTISKRAKIKSSISKPRGNKGRYSSKRLYASSDPSIATVSKSGQVKGVSKGECTIYVMNNNGVWKSVKVIVDTQPTKVAFSKARKRMKVGESQQLNVKLTPKQAETALTWQSSDPTVATVDENGTVTATGEGKAIITATAENNKIATVTIRVKGYAETANDLPEDEDTIPLEPES